MVSHRELPRDYLTYKQAADQHLYVSVRTVRRWVADGRLECVLHAGRRYVTHRAIQRYFAAREKEARERAETRSTRVAG